MNITFIIRLAAIAAALSLVAVLSTASAARLPRPLGAGEQPLSAGVHVLDLAALKQTRPGYARFPRIRVTLPSGWFNFNGWAVNDGGPLGVAFWDVDKVYPVGCGWPGKPKIDPGRTVGGLARVLATRPRRHASRPVNVTFAGFPGKYLSWSVPRDVDFSSCGQGYFESWTGRGWASDRNQQGPGQTDRLWILAVDGKRLVIDASYMPSATRRQRTELERIVQSIRFLSASPRRSAASASSGSADGARNGRWIAYATGRPGNGGEGCPFSCGSAVLVTRVGGRPRSVADRGGGRIWNLCPAFSPNGRRLAFARVTPNRSTIVVVRVGRRGPLGTGRRVLKVPFGAARCPRWSAHSSRLAYLDGRTVVVRSLDGARRHRSAGDPTIHDFDRSKDVLVSPTGGLTARSLPGSGIVVVERRDGSGRRELPNCGCWIAGWSPDGRRLLLMQDDDGASFTMFAVSVRAPYVSRTVVRNVGVNNARSWPGYGDVSWQPIPAS